MRVWPPIVLLFVNLCVSMTLEEIGAMHDVALSANSGLGYRFVSLFLFGWWLIADRSRQGKVPAMSSGMSFYALLPFSLFAYLFHSRGWRLGLRASLLVAGIFALAYAISLGSGWLYLKSSLNFADIIGSRIAGPTF